MIDRLIDSLPSSFPFYHLGQVAQLTQGTIESETELASSDLIAVAFTFQGETHGVLALLFNQDLDVSIYSEMGNIIASQMANTLQLSHGLDVSISPPRLLTHHQLKKLLSGSHGKVRTYLHQHEGRVIPLQTFVVSSEETGHA